MVFLQLGKVKFFDRLGQLSVNEPITLMGNIRTNQDGDLAYHYAKSEWNSVHTKRFGLRHAVNLYAIIDSARASTAPAPKITPAYKEV